MAAGIEPRPCQLACLRRAVEENTIVNMPTGTGKTHVAVLTIDHFRNTGKAIFMVPTRPLVGQQAEYVRKHCAAPIKVAELQGAKMDHLSASEWQEVVKAHDVLVGTAEVFRRALVDAKFLLLSAFSLLIMDECHNATGNSPMAAILRDSVHRYDGRAPRILGLTASFVNGSLKNMDTKRRDLEGLLQARLFCPDVEDRPMDFTRVTYDQTVLPAMERMVEEKVETLVDLAVQIGVPVKETRSAIRRGIHVFSELGMTAFIFFLRECVAPYVQTQIEQLAAEGIPPRNGESPRQTLQGIAQLRQAMRDSAELLANEATTVPLVTDKVVKLFDLIRLVQGAQTRVIIFCERTVLAYPLAHLLERHTGYKVGTCTGVGSMTDGQRNQALQKFCSGDTPLMTCTAALEEGLDVKACDVVVRFSPFTTTKSHIQGSGRARAWNAKVFYFDNDPDKEKEGALLMERTARESSLSLTAAEMEESRGHTDIEGVHPFRTDSGAEISVFNGVQLVYEYSARTMGQSFRPEEGMLSYTHEIISEFPLQQRRTLSEARIPSPDGFFNVTVDMVNAWWDNVDLEDVAEKTRMKNWDGSDKELRRFLYVVAVQLSRRGYLDENNRPAARALRETRHRCEAWQLSSGARIGVRYDPRGLDAGSAGQVSANRYEPCHPGAGSVGQTGADLPRAARSPPSSAAVPSRAGASPRASPAAAALSTATAPSTAAAPNTEVSPSTGAESSWAAASPVAASLCPPTAARSIVAAPNRHEAPAALQEPAPGVENHKGRLNELFNGSVSYWTVEESGSFRSIVTLPDGRAFEGLARAGTKKAAEQSAAEAAIRALSADTSQPAAGTTRQNYKGLVNEMTNGRATYSTVAVPGGFVASANLPDGRSLPGPRPTPSKKEAEQLAAEVALAALEAQPG